MRALNLTLNFESVQIVSNQNEKFKGVFVVFRLKFIFHRCFISVDVGHRAEISRMHEGSFVKYCHQVSHLRAEAARRYLGICSTRSLQQASAEFPQTPLKSLN